MKPGKAGKPIHALISCISAAEMLSMYEQLLFGDTEHSRDMWDAALKVRAFIDQPRPDNHREHVLAMIHQFRTSLQQQGRPS